MSKNGTEKLMQQAVLDVAAEAYPEPDLILEEMGGDTLADFISKEIRDVTSGLESMSAAFDAAASAMAMAVQELTKVRDALQEKATTYDEGEDLDE